MATSAAEWGEVSLFQSSSFKDMNAERDLMANLVVPALAERLKENRRHLLPIDLRWGVETVDKRQRLEADNRSDEEVAAELAVEVLSYCLAKMKGRPEPVVVVFLGHRYGWIPDAEHVRKAALRRNLTNISLEGKSVTEVELRHGILARPAKGSRV
ncbi:MAG: hypothetical protein ACRC1K_13185, partial [Planctomycetia bacterium]